MKKLAVITTHPIQYYAPVFKLLTESKMIDLKVFYTWGEDSVKPKFDPGFGKTIQWDIPLLEGYDYEFFHNISAKPGSSYFKGIVNPDAIKSIREFAPDAILVFGWAYQSHLKIIRHFSKKIPVWFRGDSNLLDKQAGWRHVARSILLRWIYHYVDMAFYVGTANKEYYKKYGLKESQLIFAPHAIDNGRFSKDRSSEAQSLRRELGIPNSDIVVLFAGKLEPKKDPELLLRAFGQLDAPGVHLLFAGNGQLESALEQESQALKSSSRVHFIPFQNQQQMPVVYQSCDLFCLPSKGPGETWGLSVNEAMAAGKAVLVSDKVGCGADLVKDGENGYIFQASNLSDLTKKLINLFSDREQLKKMGERSSAMIADMSIANQAKSYITALQ